MQYTTIGSDLNVSKIAYGMWRFGGTSTAAAQEKIEVALECGITLFDQADIYGVDGGGTFGDSEKLLGSVLAAQPELRTRMIIATKGGIRLGYPYDSSASYLRSAVENSLSRMGIERIDLYQIHRPDFLGDPAEIAQVLTELRAEGKISEVGVSNYTASQFRALQAHLPFPIVSHQPEFSAWKHSALRDGVLDQALELGLAVLAWSPLAGGNLMSSSAQGSLGNCISVLDRIAQEQGVDRAAVCLAWVLRHPANIIPIIGTQNVSRIRSSTKALDVSLSRQEWNEILIAAQGEPLP